MKVIRKIISSETIVWIVGYVSLVWFGFKQLPLLWVAIYVNFMSVIFILERAFSKRNRGQLYIGYLTREFWCFVATDILNILILTKGLDPIYAYGFIIGMSGIYLLGRGLSYSTGNKSQFIVR